MLEKATVLRFLYFHGGATDAQPLQQMKTVEDYALTIFGQKKMQKFFKMQAHRCLQKFEIGKNPLIMHLF